MITFICPVCKLRWKIVNSPLDEDRFELCPLHDTQGNHAEEDHPVH